LSRVRASVWLGQIRVGELRQDDDAFVEFHPDRRWQDDRDRPVLGQWFEERPGKRQRSARPDELPPFFANLIPEGDLGLILRERLNIAPHDDLGLLIATGGDLPGAVLVRPESGEIGEVTHSYQADDPATGGPQLKFSLAGVQLKFSMLRLGDRFVFPGSDSRGDWIVKIAHSEYAGLCENEFITMEWARRAGFVVPVCELRALGDLVDVPVQGDPATTVFTVKRYDRDGEARVHQEDLMQVLGYPNWPSTRKYNDATYDQLAFLLSRVVGPDAFTEMLRRIAFIVASGNNDAHLKNWSIMYPDGVNPRLTPLYDQTFAGQWSHLDRELALKLGGMKRFGAIDIRRFRELATLCSQDPGSAAEVVEHTIDELAAAWGVVVRELAIPDPYRAALKQHWTTTPILARHASLIA